MVAQIVLSAAAIDGFWSAWVGSVRPPRRLLPRRASPLAAVIIIIKRRQGFPQFLSQFLAENRLTAMARPFLNSWRVALMDLEAAVALPMPRLFRTDEGAAKRWSARIITRIARAMIL
jgi:hypothetical protein